MEVFLAEPFLDPAILSEIVGGVGPTMAPRAAGLEGFALTGGADDLRVAPAPQTGGHVTGALLDSDAGVARRIGFLMAAFGAGPRMVTVLTAAGETAAEAHVAARCSDGAAEPPDTGYLLEVVREVVGHFGRTDPADMPALMHGIGFRALARLRGAARDAPDRLGSGLGAADVEVLELTYAYADYFGVEARRLRHRRFDGRWSEQLRRAVLTSGDAVTVLPFDPRRSSVLLVEQFRAGAHARGDRRAARREAVEEAGLTLGRLERIAAYYTTPGIAAEFITAYVGEADLGAAGGLHGLAVEAEDIRALVVPLDEAFAAVDRGEIANAPLILSLLWLQQHHARLAAAWG